MQRLRTDFWASALIRRCSVEMIDAVLRRRGAAEAGAVFVSVDRLDGTGDLYAPAPQTLLGEELGGRLFVVRLRERPAAEIEARMAREISFDPDLWWIAIDSRAGTAPIDLAREPG